MEYWVDVEEDTPIIQAGMKRCSVDIDILMKDGTIHSNGFCTTDDDEYYTSNGKHIKYNDIKAWRTH